MISYSSSAAMFQIAFYDDREDSKTYRKLNVLPFSDLRPTLIYIPPGIWHALKNMRAEDGGFVTMNDQPFCYEDPDDWRLPPGNASLPKPF
jgi:dTDP-4-dehydrorhamnose 3,5-epimerase